MRLMLCGFMLAVAAAQATAQTMSADEKAIREAVEAHYFKAQATGSGEPLKGFFIDEGHMRWIQDGQLRQRSSGEFIAGFSGKPAEDESLRKRRIAMVDVTGDAAIVKIELDYPQAALTDYFSMLKVGGEWEAGTQELSSRAKSEAITYPPYVDGPDPFPGRRTCPASHFVHVRSPSCGSPDCRPAGSGMDAASPLGAEAMCLWRRMSSDGRLNR